MPAAAKSSTPPAENKKPANPNTIRETVESVIVAFILAFLFRAFVAEAFVIPTGSMAPTLMGAHKDTVCEHCGAQYQSTASPEFDKDDGSFTARVAVGSSCAICRASNAFDLAANGNHATFSGDRILVSKFDYLFSDPKRWDVLVFKYPNDARMNYIKRLVGLPGEQLRIEGGDVYVRKQDNDPWQIARKPADKVLAMMQVVSDTHHQPRDLIQWGWPSLWQPQAQVPGTPAHAWKIEQNGQAWKAQLPSGIGADQTHWLRYFHKYYDRDAWREAEQTHKLNPIDPHSSSLITDFLAYNTTRFVDRGRIYNGRQLNSNITSQLRAMDAVNDVDLRFDGIDLRSNARDFTAQDGKHWVGDLVAQFDVAVEGTQGKLCLDLVEFGIHYQCEIDVATGAATLRAIDNGKPLSLFAAPGGQTASQASASTAVRAGGRYQLRFANIDDQLLLWVNGSLTTFDHATAFDSHQYRAAEARRPYWTPTDPLDAAPIALGGQGCALTVHRAQVWRDIYYIAIKSDYAYADFDDSDLRAVVASIKDAETRSELQRHMDETSITSWVYANPEQWATTPLFQSRGFLEFLLDEGEFFPMGDNSAASSDARAWFGHHYVERRFLIGKALLVFWPHKWNAPVPHPNFARMGRIR